MQRETNKVKADNNVCDFMPLQIYSLKWNFSILFLSMPDVVLWITSYWVVSISFREAIYNAL